MVEDVRARASRPTLVGLGWAALVLVPIALVVVWLNATAVVHVQRAAALSGGGTVQAVVVGRSVSEGLKAPDTCVLEYSYVVAGTSYRGTGEVSDANCSSSTLLVRYDQERPAVSAPTAGTSLGTSALVALTCDALLVGAFVVAVVRRRRTR